MTASISGVLFDLDGTLYHLSKIRVRLTLMLWRTIPLLRHMSAARRAIRGRAFTSAEELGRAFAEELADRAKVTPERAASWYEQEFMASFMKLLDQRAFPRPGLLPTLSRLRSAGVKLGVVSDIGHVEERLRAIGVPPEAFHDLLSAEDTGELKPSPKSLLTVVESWGLPPEDIVVIGDRIDRDAAAARAAGMKAIVVENHAPTLGQRRSGEVPLMSWKETTRALASRAGME